MPRPRCAQLFAAHLSAEYAAAMAAAAGAMQQGPVTVIATPPTGEAAAAGASAGEAEGAAAAPSAASATIDGGAGSLTQPLLMGAAIDALAEPLDPSAGLPSRKEFLAFSTARLLRVMYSFHYHAAFRGGGLQVHTRYTCL